MNRPDDRLLPVLPLAVQALVWPGAALVRGAVPTAGEALAAAVVAGLVVAGLRVRRAFPVPVLLLVVGACALGAGALPVGAVAVWGTVGVGWALFTVGALRDTGTALLCGGTLALWQLLYGITLHRVGDSQGLDLVLTALLYAAAVGAGIRARKRRAAREAAERRLRRAEAERHRLPAAERRRMERELHDVSAHHLTGVVVTVEAARGLRERRPEMAAEALEFAARTGREVTAALASVRAPAPAGDEGPAPEERLRELVAGFRALGQPVTCEIEELPEGAVGDAAYGIVREALTNAVRHASGAATTVRCAYGAAHTEVVVTNAAPPEGAAARGAGLGGGRGRNLLRGRAREAGGTLTSGPTDEGGWEVSATLPGRDAGAPVAGVPRAYRVAQAVAALGLLVQPFVPMLVVHEEAQRPGAAVSAGLLFALLAGAQAVALLWLRRAPRTAVAALLALAWLWPAASAAGGYAGPVVLPPALSALATCVALGAVAARTAGTAERVVRVGPVRLPYVAVPVLAGVVHAGAAVVAVLGAWAPGAGTPGAGTPGASGWLVAGCVLGPVALAVAAWSVGLRYGLRGHAARTAREDRVAAWTQEAVRDAWAERRRIAGGLETTVLARTAEVVSVAEAGRLDDTAARARDALAAMRALLDTVRDGEERAELRPQPTIQALDLLVQQYRATGRDVEVHLGTGLPAELPAAVDLAAYRAAEIILEAGGAGGAGARLVLEPGAGDGAVVLTATGVPRATRETARERLAVRAAAVGGTVDVPGDGTVRVRLPGAGEPCRAGEPCGADEPCGAGGPCGAGAAGQGAGAEEREQG